MIDFAFSQYYDCSGNPRWRDARSQRFVNYNELFKIGQTRGELLKFSAMKFKVFYAQLPQMALLIWKCKILSIATLTVLYVKISNFKVWGSEELSDEMQLASNQWKISLHFQIECFQSLDQIIQMWAFQIVVEKYSFEFFDCV